MLKRYHLDFEEKPAGTLSYTLVFEDFSNYFVEQYNDSKLSFLTNRVKKISPQEFDHFSVNGQSLAELVSKKLKEISDNALDMH